MIHFKYYIYLVPMLLSAIFGLNTFRQKWPLPFRLFSVFVAVTLCMELFAMWWNVTLHATKYWHYNASNLWLYNFYLIPQYLFYLYFFYTVLWDEKSKQALKLMSILYALFSLS